MTQPELFKLTPLGRIFQNQKFGMFIDWVSFADF